MMSDLTISVPEGNIYNMTANSEMRHPLQHTCKLQLCTSSNSLVFVLNLSLIPRLPHDTLAIPSLITGASAFVLVFQWISAAWTRKLQPSSITIEEPENEPTLRATLSTSLRMLIDQSPGSALVIYQLTRLLGCLVLFGLSSYPLTVPKTHNVQRWSGIDQELTEKSSSILADPLQLGMCMTFVCVFGTLPPAVVRLTSSSRHMPRFWLFLLSHLSRGSENSRPNT